MCFGAWLKHSLSISIVEGIGLGQACQGSLYGPVSIPLHLVIIAQLVHVQLRGACVYSELRTMITITREHTEQAIDAKVSGVIDR